MLAVAVMKLLTVSFYHLQNRRSERTGQQLVFLYVVTAEYKKRHPINFFLPVCNLQLILLDSIFNYEPFRNSENLCVRASVLFDKNL